MKEKQQAEDASILDTFVAVLNGIYKEDPAAMCALIENRIPCNRTLADYPNLPVCAELIPEGEDDGWYGVINCICAELTGEFVEAVFSAPQDEEGRRVIKGFRKNSENKTE